MTATKYGFHSLALVASLLLPACDAADMGDVAQTESAMTSAQFLAQTEIVGSLDYGQTSPTVSYRNPPRLRAFKFAGDEGDHVIVDVRSSNGGDAIAWVLDDSFNTVASNDDAASGTLDAHIDVTLPAHPSRTHYIVFRDYGYRAHKFTVELQGTSGIYACQKDSDCERIVAGCCHLAYTAIHVGREDAYAASLECPDHQVCPMMMIRNTDDVAQCDNDTHQCKLVDPLAISCGGRSLNMHECPDGYVCAGEALEWDGTGACRKPCGGFGGTACDADFTCVDDPTDDCTAENGGRDCGGICQPKTCGGFGNQACPDSLTCIDDPNDSCDVNHGGADCGGICATY